MKCNLLYLNGDLIRKNLSAKSNGDMLMCFAVTDEDLVYRNVSRLSLILSSKTIKVYTPILAPTHKRDTDRKTHRAKFSSSSSSGGEGRVHPSPQPAGQRGKEEEPPGPGERGAAGPPAGPGGGQTGPAAGDRQGRN